MHKLSIKQILMLSATLVGALLLPRALAAFGVGALLALAGALMQALLRNPLADPYVLGVSGGAAVGNSGRKRRNCLFTYGILPGEGGVENACLRDSAFDSR